MFVIISSVFFRFFCWSLAQTILILYFCFVLTRAIYNIYFHPLAKYPGPWHRAAFWFPDLWTIFRGTQHEAFREMHARYGEVVRVVPDGLSYNCAGAWQDVYGWKQNKRQLTKDRNFFVGADPNISSILHSTDEDHARIRRIVSHGFSESALREQEPLLNTYFDLLVDKLKSKASGIVDMTKWYNFVTFDLVNDLVVGEPLHLLQSERFDYWTDTIFKGVKMLRYIRVAHAYPTAWLLFSLVFKIPALNRARQRPMQSAIDRVEKRMNARTNRKDIMSYIMAKNTGIHPLSRAEIQHTAANILVAGSETTATVLSGVTFYLLQNPSVLRCAQQEVREAFASSAQISLASTACLSYLTAVVQEGLRSYPAVSGSFPRRTGSQGDVVNGAYVPPDTSVGVHHWAAYKDPRNFCDPDLFIPERWLAEPPPQYADDKRETLQPFHVGPRNCIGINLALFELRSVLARLLWHFEMELCEDSVGWIKQRTFIFWDKPALNVKIRLRTD